MLLSIVHIVTILSVALCVICSLLYMMLMETYSSMGLVIALYVASIVKMEDVCLVKIGQSDHKFEWMVGSVYMNCEGVRKEEIILKLQYIKRVVWRARDDGLGIMIGGDMNAHIWELDGCENENGWRMKENMNEIGLHILNCVWDGLNEATWYTEEKKFWQEDRRWMMLEQALIEKIGNIGR